MSYKKRILILLALASSLIGNSAILSAEPAKKLNVVATYSLLGDWVHQVAGDAINLKVLVGKEGDVHVFEPLPADVIAVAKADIVFDNGLNFEWWLGKLIKASKTKGRQVSITDGITFIYTDQDGTRSLPGNHKNTKPKHSCCSHEDHDHSKPGHSHGEFDPHFWTDVKKVMIAIVTIRDSLVEADPANILTYDKNAEKYLSELTELDKWVKNEVKKIPEAQRILVTNHNDMAYFANRYHFKNLGNILNSVTTEAQDPSAMEFTALIKKVKENNVQAIFGDQLQNTALVDQLAKEAGLPKPTLLYSGTLGKAGSGASTYIEMMKYNVQAIVQALGAKE